MTLLLGVDLETTGLDETSSDIIEVGAVLWDANKHKPVEMFSKLVKIKSEIPKEITELTGIDKEMLKTSGYSLNSVCNQLTKLMYKADYLVAHNAEFEQKFFKVLEDKSLLPVKNLNDEEFKWIDTKTDIPYNSVKGDGSLISIATNFGVFNVMPHRALPDVITMFQLMSKFDIDKIVEIANHKTVKMIIKFPFDKTKVKNGKVKELGYYWNSDYKHWEKNTKENTIEVEINKAEAIGFNAKVIGV